MNNYPNLDQATLDVIATYMDDEIREELHSNRAPCHPGEFLTAYCDRDESMIAIIDQEFAHREELQ